MNELAKLIIDKNADALSALISSNKALVNQTLPNDDDTYVTPLTLAVQRNLPQIVKVLLDHGADIFATDEHSRTALNYANILGYKSIIKLFEEHKKRNALQEEDFMRAAVTGNLSEVQRFLPAFRHQSDIMDETIRALLNQIALDATNNEQLIAIAEFIKKEYEGYTNIIEQLRLNLYVDEEHQLGLGYLACLYINGNIRAFDAMRHHGFAVHNTVQLSLDGYAFNAFQMALILYQNDEQHRVLIRSLLDDPTETLSLERAPDSEQDQRLIATQQHCNFESISWVDPLDEFFRTDQHNQKQKSIIDAKKEYVSSTLLRFKRITQEDYYQTLHQADNAFKLAILANGLYDPNLIDLLFQPTHFDYSIRDESKPEVLTAKRVNRMHFAEVVISLLRGSCHISFFNGSSQPKLLKTKSELASHIHHALQPPKKKGKNPRTNSATLFYLYNLKSESGHYEVLLSLFNRLLTTCSALPMTRLEELLNDLINRSANFFTHRDFTSSLHCSMAAQLIYCMIPEPTISHHESMEQAFIRNILALENLGDDSAEYEYQIAESFIDHLIQNEPSIHQWVDSPIRNRSVSTPQSITKFSIFSEDLTIAAQHQPDNTVEAQKINIEVP